MMIHQDEEAHIRKNNLGPPEDQKDDESTEMICVYVGVPTNEIFQDDETFNLASKIMKMLTATGKSVFTRPLACNSIITLQILYFTILTGFFGFASRADNPFIGPPVQSIDTYGAKNPWKIKEGEYWRLVTALFQSVGIVDLFFSICMVISFGKCLEERWGSFKFLFLYLVTGVSGNLYSILCEPSAASVGNGASILGVLGSVHIDMLTSILSAPVRGQSKEEKRLTEKCFARCVVISGGMLIGVLITCGFEVAFTDDKQGSIKKDWSVLYGGMICGILCGSISNLVKVEWEVRKKLLSCLTLAAIPILLNRNNSGILL